MSGIEFQVVPNPSADPAADVEGIQVRRFREMGPRGRLKATLELNAALERLALAGIRARYGRLPADQERLRLFALRLGRAEMRAAFGWDPASKHG